MDRPLRKYPRTPHLTGSRRQPGDEELAEAPLGELVGRPVVVTEKVDGANVGISFGPDGALLLQSRGHYLTGGPREAQFAPFKRWAHGVAEDLRRALGGRYVLYGEWLWAKHTLFYDRLPHYFLAFDLLDTATGEFLDTPQRLAALAGVPVASVPTVFAGRFPRGRRPEGWLGRSAFASEGHLDALRAVCARRGLDPDRVLAGTDPSGTMEGLYLKVEEGGTVRARFKYVRASFSQVMEEAGDHWLDRPLVPNLLRPGADPFGESRP